MAPSPDAFRWAMPACLRQAPDSKLRHGHRHAKEDDMGRLCEGRVAIVTGAGGGLGRQHALLLAAHGAKVMVNDIGANLDGTGTNAAAASAVVDSIKQAGGTAVANAADVSDWKGAQAMIEEAVDTFGRLDVLVNNAGILRDRMLTNMAEEEWDAVIRVHLKGTFAPSRHAAAYWRAASKRENGLLKARIINTTSTSGIYGNVGQTNYGAAKAGIAAFTIIAARELARYGVTVNAISPSAQTRMTEGLRELSEKERIVRDPRWVSPTVVYLASEDAQDITGRVIQAGIGRIAVCEGWRRGAEVGQVEDPGTAGSLLREMIAKVRKNSGMDGLELD
jgi:NAD(P)-dependent dehydrogenase (short-subunit alcohol dehydrogenase family)